MTVKTFQSFMIIHSNPKKDAMIREKTNGWSRKEK